MGFGLITTWLKSNLFGNHCQTTNYCSKKDIYFRGKKKFDLEKFPTSFAKGDPGIFCDNLYST
jgi:hypothetical protein